MERKDGSKEKPQKNHSETEHPRREAPQQRGPQRWIPLIVILVAVVAVIAVLGVALNRSAANRSERAAERESEEGIIQNRDVDENLNEIITDPDLIAEAEGTEDLVIFGVDSRSNDLGIGTRSDSIMIVHIDHDEKTVKIASIYRDCMVDIEGHGYEKITHAHQYGGPELALSTINENFDLDIEKYMTLNFTTVSDLVNEIGGVEMEITEEEYPQLKNTNGELIDGIYSGVITEPGTYLLDGDQAVAYSRIRHAAGDDYKRAERQRDVLIALLDKAKTMNTDDVLTLVDDMLAMINSNYRASDLTSMIYYLADYDIVETTAYPKVFYGGTVEGAWVEVPITLIDMNAGLHEFLYDEMDYTPSADVQNINDVLLEKESVPNEDLSVYAD